MATGLFARVPRERLKAVLENLHAFTQIPIHLIDSNGERLMNFGESRRQTGRRRTRAEKRT